MQQQRAWENECAKGNDFWGYSGAPLTRRPISPISNLAPLCAAVGGGALASLQTLNLKRCSKLTSLPSEISSLTSLTDLNLSACRLLQSLPAELGSLTSLRTLSLNGCDYLTSLPAELVSLTSLRTLELELSNTHGRSRAHARSVGAAAEGEETPVLAECLGGGWVQGGHVRAPLFVRLGYQRL